MDVIYIGSGKSAELIKEIDHTKYTIVCANNAWRLFENKQPFDYWLHSGDFPHENHPPTKNFKYEISHLEYESAISDFVANVLKMEISYSHHYVGYTIFFQGLYWIFHHLKPRAIYLLGFDHDYNKEKTKKWFENKQPNPQNNFLKCESETIKQWSENFFKGFEPDFFYGHGTPDPLRLGENELRCKFKQAEEIAKKLGIDVFNASPVFSAINTFPKANIA